MKEPQGVVRKSGFFRDFFLRRFFFRLFLSQMCHHVSYALSCAVSVPVLDARYVFRLRVPVGFLVRFN